MNEPKGQRTLKPKQGQARTHPLKKSTVIGNFIRKQNGLDGSVQEPALDPMTKTSWTVAELRHTKLPEQRWAIPGIIPIGLTFLGGLPKAGKSWLSLQIAHAVGTGGEVLGVKVEKRKVLYLALEDGPHRLKERIEAQNIPDETDLQFEIDWPKLEEGGIKKIGSSIDDNFVFVVIDTLSRACGVDQLRADEVVNILGPLQKLAITRNVSILVNDHNTKARNLGVILKLFGSIAKSGIADAIFCLEHLKDEKGAMLRGVGRDVGSMTEEIAIALMWDRLGNCWKNIASPLIPDHPQTLPDKVRKAIHDFSEQGNKMATSTTIAKYLDLPQSDIHRVLQNLYSEGKVGKGEKIGREVPYYLP
jgi:hypothetical protein